MPDLKHSCSSSLDRVTQVPKGSKKMTFPVYEHLLLLDENLAETVRILQNIRGCSGISQRWFKYYEAQIEELRAEASGDVVNVMDDLEQKEGVRHGKQAEGF